MTGPVSGKTVMSSGSGIIVRGAVEAVAAWQLMLLLKFHERLDLVGGGNCRRCRRNRRITAPSTGSPTGSSTPGGFIIGPTARIRAGARQLSEIQRNGCGYHEPNEITKLRSALGFSS